MAGYIGSGVVSLSTTGADIDGNITVDGTVDGRDVSVDGTKLDGIEASSTADQTKADIEGLGIDLPAANLTGTVVAARLSTAATQAESDASTKIATTAYVSSKLTTLIGGAPSTLNDLNELAQAINDDANYNSTLTTALATKMPLAGGAFTGAVTTNSTIDGVDIATRDAVLTSTTTTANAALPKAGGALTGNLSTTGQIDINTGSASAPVLKFTHTNSGADNFQLGAGTPGVSNGGFTIRDVDASANRLVINASGNVGIGTSSPSTRLTVLASSANGIDLAQDPDNGANSGRLFFTTSGGTNSIRSTSGALQFSTGATAGSSSGTERMRIDSSGNVGINTSAPTDSAWGGGNKEFAIDGTTGYSVIHLRGTGAGSTDTRFSHGVGDTKYFIAYDDVVGAHRMIVDALGNILVGKSVSDSAANGVELSQSGQIYITANNTLPFYINRRGTGGANEFARFSDDGLTRGSISSAFANELIVSASGTNSSGILFSSANTIRPMKNGATSSGTQDLGASNGQWKDLYLSGGIQFDSRSNKLDDYEEGTWTPDLKLANSGSVTYSARAGRYTKIGRKVTAHCMVFNTAHVGSGLAYIHGLPFTSNSESVGSAQMNQHSDSHSSDVGSINSVIQGNDAKIHMRATYNSNTAGPLYIQLQNFTYLRISITYTAA